MYLYFCAYIIVSAVLWRVLAFFESEKALVLCTKYTKVFIFCSVERKDNR